MLTFEPLIPAALWVTLAVAMAAMLAWYARRRPGGLTARRWVVIVFLMTVAATLLLAILLNPTWVEPIPAQPGNPGSQRSCGAFIRVKILISAGLGPIPGRAHEARGWALLRGPG